MKSKIFLTILVVLIILIGIGLKFFNLSDYLSLGSKQESYELNGSLVEVRDDILIIKGTYKVASTSPVQNQLVLVEIKVIPDTKITRIALKVPNTTEVFYPEKLPKEQTTVGIKTLTADSNHATLGMTVKSSSNVYGKTKFTAERIIYRVPIFQIRN